MLELRIGRGRQTRRPSHRGWRRPVSSRRGAGACADEVHRAPAPAAPRARFPGSLGTCAGSGSHRRPRSRRWAAPRRWAAAPPGRPGRWERRERRGGRRAGAGRCRCEKALRGSIVVRGRARRYRTTPTVLPRVPKADRGATFVSRIGRAPKVGLGRQAALDAGPRIGAVLGVSPADLRVWAGRLCQRSTDGRPKPWRWPNQRCSPV
jgi:hypothetical protein